jgi:hypothetical protein
MSLNEIIFRLFAWARPLLWYYHRLGRLLEVAILQLQDDDYCLWLFDNPKARAWFEGVLVDGERCLEIAIAYRVREILSLPMPATPRIGIGGFHRIHTPSSLLHLAGRLDRLVDRYNAIERLAQLRAARIRREMDEAPVLLVADHRPANPNPTLLSLLLSSPFFFFPPAATSTGQRIRGPPRPGSIAKIQPAPTRRHHLRDRALTPSGTASGPSPHAPARTTTHFARR